MTVDTVQAPFTRDLLKWLINIGYTHVFCEGIINKSVGEPDETTPYIIHPLRLTDEQWKIEEDRNTLEPITSSDVSEMTDEDYPRIWFVAVIPAKEYASFLNP